MVSSLESASDWAGKNPAEATFIIVITVFVASLILILITTRPRPTMRKRSLKKKRNLKKFNPSVQKSTSRSFCAKMWTRIRNFYIEALMIPEYRDEWGKYNHWNFKSPQRPKGLGRKRRIKNRRTRFKLKNAFFRTEKFDFSILDDVHKVPELPHASHDHHMCYTMTLNISGTKFQAQLRTLNQFPDTVLGDPLRRMKFFDPMKGEFYFDRNPTCFGAILYFYQSGGLIRKPTFIPTQIFLQELIYFEIGKDNLSKYMEEEGLRVEEDKEMPKNLLLRKLWLFIEHSESSKQARVFASMSIFVIFISTTIFIIDTMEVFKSDTEPIQNPQSLNNGSQGEKPYGFIATPFTFTESISIFWYTLEIILRFISCPSEFVKDFLNIIDFMSILPYYLGVFNTLTSRENTSNVTFMRVIRLVRVFRVFKLSRHSNGLKILGKTLQASMHELGILIFFLFIAVILFSSVVYFAEVKQPGTHYTSVPEAFWWAIVTMTTVGYGDIVPKGIWGKIVGSFSAITGVLTIALPVPIIVSNFNYFYHRDNVHDGVDLTKKKYTFACPYLPGLPEDYEKFFQDFTTRRISRTIIRNRI